MSPRTRWEIAAALATGALHPVFFHFLHLKGVFIAIVLGSWLCYLVVRVRARPTLLAEWGLSTANLEQSSAATAVVAVCVIAVLAWMASRGGSLPVHWHMKFATKITKNQRDIRLLVSLTIDPVQLH